MISFDTQNRATGSKDAKTRETIPKTTTARPDSQTKRSTSGTLRRAESRSRHPLQNCGASFMTRQALSEEVRPRSFKVKFVTKKDLPIQTKACSPKLAYDEENTLSVGG